MSNFQVEVASIPTHEKLVAEIYYKNEQWVEISHETDELLITFFSPLHEDYWEFSFEEAFHALEEAKNKLLKCS